MTNKTSGREHRWYRLDQSLGVDRGDMMIALTSTVLGGIVGWAAAELFSDPSQLGLWSVAAIGIIALLTCTVIWSFLTAFQHEGNDRLDRITATVDTLGESISAVERAVTQSIDQFAVLIPRDSIYPEMARCIREAQEQVVVITYFMYDWDKNVRTFDPAVKGDVPGVDEFYDAIYEAIKKPNVEYLRVWQVPEERLTEARAKIVQDPRLQKEIDLIESISPDNPDLCRIRIVSQATTASIILVDRTTLFFNVDLFDSDRGTWLSPFMLMVRDARGRAFADLKRVVVKLSNN